MGKKRKYRISKKEVIDAWAKNHPLVMTWLKRYARAKDKAHSLWIFSDWANLTPEELLALKEDPRSLEAERLLDRFVADEDFDIPNSIRWNVANTVKGFFSANYKDLARRSGSIDLRKVRPYNKPTKEDLQKLYDVCYNPRDRSMVVSLPNSTGIAKDSIVNLKWNHLEDGWEKIDIPHISLPPELIKGHGRGRYKGVRQETFLTPEAKEDLLKYREWMERVKGVEFTPESNVYRRIDGPYEALTSSALGKIVWDIAKRADVQYSLHDARRYVQTALEEAKINPNWARKIRGRKVRGEESPYSRPAIEELRMAYRSALPYLMFRSKPELSEEERLKRAILANARLTLSEDKVKQIERIVRSKPGIKADEIIRIIKQEQNEAQPKTEQNGGCANGSNCPTFKEIHEEDLLSHLQDGWQIVHNLQNGRVIVKRLSRE